MTLCIKLSRWALFALTLFATLLSIFLAITCLPEADRIPASPEFGAPQWDWAAETALAMLLLGAAVWASSGALRSCYLALMLTVLLLGIASDTYRIRSESISHPFAWSHRL